MPGILNYFRDWRKSLVLSKARRRRGRAIPTEALEARMMLFAATGNAWANPQVVTISFMPDGTNMGGPTNNLNSAFNAKTNLNGVWQTQILKAAQSWAQQTNLNFTVVTDSGADSGSGSYQQGDPTMGDIRIGGYAFGDATLARAYAPPPVNNYSIAGDIAFNTGQSFNIGSTYDLFTVATHEFGHALGLDHTKTSGAEMYSSYNGVKSTLNTDDISGILSIYSKTAARSKDAYDAVASNDTYKVATNVTSLINTTTKSAVINNMDITTTADIDYYKFTAPTGCSSTLTVTVQSRGLSLLTPKAFIYNASQVQMATATGSGFQGSTLTLTANGIVAGQTYYIKVCGADTTAFSTGRYAVTLNMGTQATPAVTYPNTQVANGSPLSGAGGVADGNARGDDLFQNVPTITAISTDTGASNADRVTSDRTLIISGTAPQGYAITVYRNGTAVGTTTTSGSGRWSLDTTGTSLADGSYTFTATSTDLSGTVSSASSQFNVTVDTVAPNAPTISGFSPDSGIVGDSITNASRPTFTGTAAASSQIRVMNNGNPIGTTMSDGTGNWSFTPNGSLPNGTDTITATAADLAGNVSVASSNLVVKIDTTTTTPIIAGVAPFTNSDGTTSLQAEGTAEAGSTVQVSVNGIAVGSTTADASGNWNFLYNANGSTACNFSAASTDVAGNSTGVAATFNVYLGSDAATSTTTLSAASDTGTQGDGITANQTPTLTGTSTAGLLITILDGNTVIGTTTADLFGNWSFTCSTQSLGSHSYSSYATDLLLRKGLLSSAISLKIQTAIV